jgi:hypothetical protein
LNLSSLAAVDKSQEKSQHPLIHLPEERKHEVHSKNLFERHSFQDLIEHKPHVLDQVNLHNYPEMLRIREEFIHHKEQADKHELKQQLKAQMLTPRTYSKKQYEIEKWVEMQREEVKKSRKYYEDDF